MDRNALAELLQALESRRDAEERRREERYTALIERRADCAASLLTSAMSDQHATQYDLVKQAILRRLNITTETHRARFREYRRACSRLTGS
ncbi:UNVERIFIED_CONTAM: hypothetical protein FKN15_001551 [Acipenser sinensis]